MDQPVLRDLIVLGGGLGGFSVAAEALRAGARRVLVLLDAHVPVLDPTLPVDVVRGAGIEDVVDAGDHVTVSTGDRIHRARVVIDGRPYEAPTEARLPVEASVAHRVVRTPDSIAAHDTDVLVVGTGDRAVSDAAVLERAGARVVLALGGPSSALGRSSRTVLARLEGEGRITVLHRSMPIEVLSLGGDALAVFADRRTPDLVFDAIVEAYEPSIAAGTGRFLRLGSVAPGSMWAAATAVDTTLPAAPAEDRVPARRPVEIERLRADQYNATITSFEQAHRDLWVLRIRPDRSGIAHTAGQYATLGLGTWEPRADDAEEGAGRGRDRMIRRSYSISSRILDEVGYLVDPREEDDIELYIVHVRPDGDRIPQLTPRLALKRAGDRVHLGPKITGRYTLRPVTDPESDVVFLATGTGEAPHNAMIGDLLRRGHTGRIVSVVTVRFNEDLAYEATHRTLERRFPNYRYLTLPTREPGVPKRYIQDVISDGTLASLTGFGLDPDRTHVFLCGNPTMIGLPDEAGVWPESTGVCELLSDRGFVLDGRGAAGSIHYEEYW